MKQIDWEERLETGIGIIDGQHQNLFRYYNNFVSALHEGGEKEAVAVLLDDLRHYAIYHFETEASLMRRHGYPGVGKHMDMHRDFISRIDEMAVEFIGGMENSSEMLSEFLLEWIRVHIGIEDFKLAEFLRNKKL